MIKVLVVDDSAFIRRLLTDILNSDNEISVVGTARNGKEALEKIESLQPDIVTLDIEMPLMDGITALKLIVSNYEIPVIMISSETTESADLTLMALYEGAVDFISKPRNVFKIGQPSIKQDIINKVKTGARSKLHIRKATRTIVSNLEKKEKVDVLSNKFDTLIAIGTSTGGPKALQMLIPSLPSNINAAIFIVQHMPPKFTKSLSERLNYISNIKIKEAEEGDIVTRGYGYVAPGDYHMTVHEESDQLIIRLNQEPQVMGLRPTVDKLMLSISQIKNFEKIGIILTGMGSDGTNGIVNIKKAGGFTIAQDELSSVVYGMPKAAIATNFIDEVLSLSEIANRIINKVGV